MTARPIIAGIEPGRFAHATGTQDFYLIGEDQRILARVTVTPLDCAEDEAEPVRMGFEAAIEAGLRRRSSRLGNFVHDLLHHLKQPIVRFRRQKVARLKVETAIQLRKRRESRLRINLAEAARKAPDHGREDISLAGACGQVGVRAAAQGTDLPKVISECAAPARAMQPMVGGAS